MEAYRLPPRLAAIAKLVPAGARLADVGTDHGLLPILLLKEGRIASALATDIRQGPLDRAIANAALHGVDKITFRLCNGLESVTPEEADTVVIAGMGGENIAGILAGAPWCRAGVRLILQPMSRPEAVRRALPALGLHIRSETLTEDAGRLYSIILAEGGPADEYTEAELYTGLFRHVQNDRLFLRLLDEQASRLTPAVRGLECSPREEDAQRLLCLKKALQGITEARRRYHDDCTEHC